jgi:glycine C-acetyltransferase
MNESGTQTTKQNPLQYVSETLQDLRAKGVAPKLRVLEGEQKPVCVFDGREVINLASNNYLGLTSHKALRRAAIEAVRKLGVGAGAVRTIAGTMKLHMDLEERIAKFKHAEACVVFQSGFTANAGTVSAVLGKDDLIISDELNHASIIDGARLSKAAIKVFKHKDVQDCERILEEHGSFPGQKLIITDGVFSMDGDIAPLPQLCDLAEKYGCIMMVDDAHASGVLGQGGRGSIDHWQCHGRVHIQVGTLSKAIGSMGGYVCGSRDLIDYLYLRARPFLFSTSHPPATAAACQAAFALLDSVEGEKLVRKLWANTKFFKRELKKRGFQFKASETPIIPIHVGDAAKAFEFSRRLFDAGVFAPAVGYPTVAEGKARLRAIVSAAHKREYLLKAAETLAEVAKPLGIIRASFGCNSSRQAVFLASSSPHSQVSSFVIVLNIRTLTLAGELPVSNHPSAAPMFREGASSPMNRRCTAGGPLYEMHSVGNCVRISVRLHRRGAIANRGASRRAVIGPSREDTVTRIGHRFCKFRRVGSEWANQCLPRKRLGPSCGVGSAG